jgi:glycine oxidase
MKPLTLTVVGAGIAGLWQALTLARRGHRVRLLERSAKPFVDAASLYAGAMLGPYCEAEAAHEAVRDLGLRSLQLWRDTFPGLVSNGTLVLAGTRDRSELTRFARMTEGFETVDAVQIADIEPDLAGRFAAGLFYRDEAHLVPEEAMRFLLDEIRRAGAEVAFGAPWQQGESTEGLIIDCRGLAARSDLPDLRGIRGERVVVRTAEVHLTRPVRLLHPRQPLYVVPWSDGRYMIGATVIESDEAGPMTVRSALELLGMAYALHPAFAEAEIIDLGAGVRPAFPDNLPKVVVRGPRFYVNGLYRHGFLLSPALAELVADYLEGRPIDQRVFSLASQRAGS